MHATMASSSLLSLNIFLHSSSSRRSSSLSTVACLEVGAKSGKKSTVNGTLLVAQGLNKIIEGAIPKHDFTPSHKFEKDVANPSDVYLNLCTVDLLENLGIGRYFSEQINDIMESAFRWWMEVDKNLINSELETFAIAFRLLRMHSYDVSSEVFAHLDEDKFHDGSLMRSFERGKVVLELFKASEIKISLADKVLEKLNTWSRNLLKQYASSRAPSDENEKVLILEVKHALNFPVHVQLDSLEHKQNIERFNKNKALSQNSYMYGNIDTSDLLQLAVGDFNACQSMFVDEFNKFEGWCKEKKLDQLSFFIKPQMMNCYFSAAAALYTPQMSVARMSWAKNSILASLLDDLFDDYGSIEELTNFVHLLERWESNYDDCCSEHVKILYSALHETISELAIEGSVLQGYDVTRDFIHIWIDFINAMMKEAKWTKEKVVPSLDEYIENGFVSFALGPIIMLTEYLVGPKLPCQIVENPEFHYLFRRMSTIGRLLNDIQGFEREKVNGKLNSVSLKMLEANGQLSEEESKDEVWRMIERERAELLKLVVQKEGSIVPRACKDLVWNQTKLLSMIYMKSDGHRSPKEFVGAVDSLINKPLDI